MEGGGKLAAAFLARSRSFPVEIYLSGSAEHDHEFLELTRDHIGHCRRLSITVVSAYSMEKALGYLSQQEVPLLSSIELKISEDIEEDFELHRPLFPLSTPHLTTVQLFRINSSSLPFCLPAFTSVTSLQLTGIWTKGSAAGYAPLRDTLMALPALNLLELQLDSFSRSNLRPPMALPTIRFLQIEGNAVVYNDDIIHSIYAESLTTLSIDGWNHNEPELDFSRGEGLKSHFPSLQHLILRNISPDVPDLQVVALRFPGIERLTCHAQESLNPATSDIYHVITHIGDDENDGGDVTSRQRWPNLHTIAVIASDTPLDAVALHGKISRLQEGGHPIRKLKLPNHLCQMAGAESMARLQEIIEVDDFSMDWPAPFEFI